MGRMAALLLAGFLLLMSGCGGSSDQTSTSQPPGPTQAEEKAETKVKRETIQQEARREQQELRREANRKRISREMAQQREEAEEARARHKRATENQVPHNTEAKACGSYTGKDAFACEDSYEICSFDAKQVVEGYYHETSAVSLDAYAMHYAKETYVGHADPYEDLVWQSGYAGCLAALMDEYDTLYG
jgi:hypothetical protein